MSRSLLLLGLVATGLSLTACESRWPDWLELPRGYSDYTYTPVSKPHGYDRTRGDEQMAARQMTDNAIAWQRTMDIALPDLAANLNIADPIAVTMKNGASPAALSASNYLREQLVKRGFLLGVGTEAPQTIDVAARESALSPDMVDLTLRILRGQSEVATHNLTALIPNQVLERDVLPGFTAHPKQ